VAVYAYIALEADASRVEGTVIADTPRQARDDLRDRGLTVQSITDRPRKASRGTWSRWVLRGSRHTQDVQMLVRELSTLVGVGLPLLDAIDTVLRQLKGPKHAAFRGVVLTLRDRVASGASLAEAMGEQPDVFDDIAVSLVAVGEDSGQLDEALAQLADFRQRSAQFRGRVASALMYPAIVLCMGVGVAVFLMTFVTPSLLESLLESGKPLPWATRVVKGISDTLVQRWWLILGVMLVAASGIGLLLSTSRGKWWRDTALLRLPVIGDLIRKQATVRIAAIVATLMRSGVEFLRAIEVAQSATQNRVLCSALGQARQAVGTGREIGPALDASGAFPPTVVQVFDVGQQSGRLEEMLDRLAADYDQQVTTATTRLTTLLQPVLIVLLAGLVGFIAFATILPILEAGRVL